MVDIRSTDSGGWSGIVAPTRKKKKIPEGLYKLYRVEAGQLTN
jgi:hypothetical protein